jgi:hypothetical protein
MTLPEFVMSVRNEEPIFGGARSEGGKIVEGWYSVDPLNLFAVTAVALKIPGLLPPDTDPDEALRLIDEAFTATP